MWMYWGRGPGCGCTGGGRPGCGFTGGEGPGCRCTGGGLIVCYSQVLSVTNSSIIIANILSNDKCTKDTVFPNI